MLRNVIKYTKAEWIQMLQGNDLQRNMRSLLLTWFILFTPVMKSMTMTRNAYFVTWERSLTDVNSIMIIKKVTLREMRKRSQQCHYLVRLSWTSHALFLPAFYPHSLNILKRFILSIYIHISHTLLFNSYFNCFNYKKK